MMEQTYTGIDVAKDSFVVATRLAGKVTTSLHSNDRKGIQKFLKSLPSETWCIMEATGVYSLQLAIALYEKGVRVSVVNPRRSSALPRPSSRGRKQTGWMRL